eukprot:1144365-Pelagomonas_calceolata.AAC.1
MFEKSKLLGCLTSAHVSMRFQVQDIAASGLSILQTVVTRLQSYPTQLGKGNQQRDKGTQAAHTSSVMLRKGRPPPPQGLEHGTSAYAKEKEKEKRKATQVAHTSSVIKEGPTLCIRRLQWLPQFKKIRKEKTTLAKGQKASTYYVLHDPPGGHPNSGAQKTSLPMRAAVMGQKRCLGPDQSDLKNNCSTCNSVTKRKRKENKSLRQPRGRVH